MPNTVVDPHALLLTPFGRDADVSRALLAEVGIEARPVLDVPELVRRLKDNVLFAVIGEESLRTADIRPLADWVQAQPTWSDLPFVLLTRHGGGPERNPAAARFSEALGNVTFVERPFHPTTFLSVAKTAQKGRRRQYESRSTLEQLRESGERLETALKAGRLGSWEFDVDRQELITTPSCRSIFGRGPQEDFSYDDLLESIHPDDLQRVQGALRHTVETGDDYVIEYRTIWTDGSHHWVEVRARLVRTRQGHRLVGVSSDITARKSAEEQLRFQNETLEARVAARTRELERAHRDTLEQMSQRELAEGKLRQSQKMELIGQLTGGVAHDFNNLLMAVIGNLDLLRRHVGGDTRALRLIDGAQQGAKRGASLTQRLLAFARRQDLSLVVADLAELVRGMVPLIERTIGSSIELRFELPEGPARSELDVNQVELALLNLVVNARDAMPSGGTLTIRVDLGEWPDADAPGFVRLTVTDTGHGMDAATLEKATEPFFSTKGVGKGTGLGLSMIHGLVEQLGGEFRLASLVDEGTTAELLFPATDKVVSEPAAEPTAPEAALPQNAPLRILMVDDDALIAMSSVDMLEDLGHEVVEANSGDAALRHLADGETIDLMITDFSMPRMNGAQLARAARNLRPGLPIILATGYADLPSGEEIDLPRLAKPYDQRQLAAQIEAVRAKG